ncbi:MULTISPECIES: YlxR family protein [Corynebacterium]|uniref:YlxR domain-containing protein n=1 Tax=Corynebacterium auriscanis TaxID=99807 RepID=A0A0A2DJP8_9CORY|nr:MULTISPECIES: YlxR family protein [Corynebacterium]KGM19398.1 hypothetical protein MA47_00585 [Corynebacterium auriscanis]OFT89658.1 hypothetical protein HMPREF3098_04850 [Corynebacterium sp. HMSC28B08]WJY72881.1 hypothetical protein CAURIC_06275 [Corynebacterium auriscanis]
MNASKAHVPQRTCIATREILPVPQLLRVVAHVQSSGTVAIVPDPRRRLGGRGAWIQPTLDAVNTAHTRRAFARALKVSAAQAIDVDPVRTYIEGLPRNEANP